MSETHDETAAPSGSTAQDPAGPGGSEEPRDATAGGTVPRAELEKVIRERQAAKQRARAAEEQLAAMGAPPAEAPSEGGEAIGRKLRDREAQLAALLRDQQLRQAATRAGAINPDQVVGILQSRVVMAEQADGALVATFLDERGNALLNDHGDPADADALVRGFLAEAANANLLGPVSAPGSGARPTGGAPTRPDAPATLAEFNALPPDQRRLAAMRMSRRQREAMLGIGRPGHDGYL